MTAREDMFEPAEITVQRGVRETATIAYYSEVELYRCTECAALVEDDYRHLHKHDGPLRADWRRAAERGVLDDVYVRDDRVIVTLLDGAEKHGRVVGVRGVPWLINVIFDDDPHTTHGWVDRNQHAVRREVTPTPAGRDADRH